MGNVKLYPTYGVAFNTKFEIKFFKFSIFKSVGEINDNRKLQKCTLN